MKGLRFICMLIFSLLVLTFAGSGGPNRPQSNRWHYDPCQSGYNEIRLYGGSIAFGATYHALIVLKSACGTYRLLEVGKDGSTIDINDQIGTSTEEALAKRNNKDSSTTKWGGVEYVQCSYQSVQNVINQYHGTIYNAINNNCRCFVNKLHYACGSNKRTTSGDPLGSFDCGSDGKIGCCSIFDTTCCCAYSDGSIHSYHSWGKHRKCVHTKNCDLGWKC
jgi:hypothetical protein